MVTRVAWHRPAIVQEVQRVRCGAGELPESGCSLILGTVLPDGEPHAAGWAHLLPVAVRCACSDAEDSAGRPVAAEAFRHHRRRRPHASVDAAQGPVLSVEAASSDDVDRAARFCDDFFTDIATPTASNGH
jgi:hypothetical protein